MSGAIEKEFRPLVKWLRKEGDCTIERDGNNHLQVYGPDGRRITWFPYTTKSHRAKKELIAKLRRAGIDVPRRFG